MPIKDSAGDVVGVAQVINKQGDQCFSVADEKVSKTKVTKAINLFEKVL